MKRFWVLISCLFFFQVVSAQPCQNINSFATLQKMVSADSCYIFTGSVQIENDFAVLGKLYIQTNSQIHFNNGARLLISNEGQIVNRGILSFTKRSSLTMYKDAHLQNLGKLNVLENSKLFIFDNASVKSSGQLNVQHSSLILFDSVNSFANLGYFNLINSNAFFKAHNFLNQGTINSTFVSRLFLSDKAYALNKGQINLDKSSFIYLEDQALFENIKNLNLSGIFIGQDDASFINNGNLNLDSNARVIFADNLKFKNIKNIENYGKITVLNSSSVLNAKGTLTIKKGGLLFLTDDTVFVNKAAMRNQGSFIKLKRQFINENIYFDDQKMHAH